MSYSQLIDRNLTKAFKLLGDISSLATFIKKPDTTFNFSTRSVKSSTTETLEIPVVVMGVKKTSKDRNVKGLQIIFKTSALGDSELYDTVIVDGINYKLGNYLSNDGYLSSVEIFKEN